jgi:hypothetical protein
VSESSGDHSNAMASSTDVSSTKASLFGENGANTTWYMYQHGPLQGPSPALTLTAIPHIHISIMILPVLQHFTLPPLHHEQSTASSFTLKWGPCSFTSLLSPLPYKRSYSRDRLLKSSPSQIHLLPASRQSAIELQDQPQDSNLQTADIRQRQEGSKTQLPG